MKLHLVRLTSVLSLTVLLAACGSGDWQDQGPVVTQTRETPAFEAIRVSGATRLEIRVGEPASLQLRGGEKLLEHIDTQVQGQTLHIKTRHRDAVWSKSDAQVVMTITVPTLTELKLEGGNDVHVTGYAGGKSTLDIEGAANIKAEGTLDALTVKLAGAGNAELDALTVNEARVTVDGVGSVSVHATQSLDATMNGVGAIFYSGNPGAVSTRMNGVGTIAQRKAGEGDAPAKPVDPKDLQPELEKSAASDEVRIST